MGQLPVEPGEATRGIEGHMVGLHQQASSPNLTFSISLQPGVAASSRGARGAQRWFEGHSHSTLPPEPELWLGTEHRKSST